MTGIDFKARTPIEGASVVISFASRWLTPLVEGRVHAVIRRQFPKARQPAWLYAYVASPVSELVLRAEVKSITQVNLDESLRYSSELLLSRGEIATYFEGYEEMGLYLLGLSTPSRTSLKLGRLQEAGRFSPPQSFLYLSSEGREFLDSSCGFPRVEAISS